MKLPFVPFSFLQPLTHRNLEGDDYSELSVHLIFALSMVLYRNILQRMGERRQWRPKQPKQLSIFEMAAAEAEKYDKAK